MSGEILRFGKVKVETIPTPHDSVDGVAFVVDDGKHRLGVLTDLGYVFNDLEDYYRVFGRSALWKATTIMKCSPAAIIQNG